MRYHYRWSAVLLAVLLLLSFSLAGCGRSEDTSETTETGAVVPESSPETQEAVTEPAPPGEIKLEKILNYSTPTITGMDADVTTWRITSTFQTPRLVDIDVRWRDADGFLVDGPRVAAGALTGGLEFPMAPESSIIGRSGLFVKATPPDKMMELVVTDKGEVQGYDSSIKILDVGKPENNRVTLAVENTGTATRHMAYVNIIGIDSSGQPVFGWIADELFNLPPGEKAKWEFTYNAGLSMPEDKWAKSDVILSVVSLP